jgi:soluble lytic murein transglycosylase-like protein
MLAQHKAALYLSAAIKWLLTALLMLWLPTSVLASTENHDAQVWLMDKSNRMSRFSKDPQQRLSLLRSIHRAATRADLNPEVVLAVIEVESHFNRFAVSSVGAQGMMQVMPFWKNEIGRADDNLIDLETNLRYGCTILKHYIKRSDGHLANALARYNGSYGSYRYSSKVMDAWDKWR